MSFVRHAVRPLVGLVVGLSGVWESMTPGQAFAEDFLPRFCRSLHRPGYCARVHRRYERQNQSLNIVETHRVSGL